jgi:hypothetical protein
MGTTLTGTTPQDTYDSLIKVTDNGPISGTAKYLSDGLGNDSTLALSTANVGIGTTSPAVYGGWRGLDIRGGNGGHLIVANTADTNRGELYTDGNGFNVSAKTNNALLLKTNDTEKVRITDAGNVGIGTTTPSEKLTINGSLGFQQSGTQTYHINPASSVLTFVRSGIADVMSVTANGLCFGSDTAAANALDDYEEGTWTMGVSFGGASVGVTYANNTGTYTKIGRQVTVNGLLTLTSKGTSTGSANITGLPFNIKSETGFYGAPSIWIQEITFADQFQALGLTGTTQIALSENTNAGIFSLLNDTNFGSNVQIAITYSYFV